jgi:hypothetical protein
MTTSVTETHQDSTKYVYSGKVLRQQLIVWKLHPRTATRKICVLQRRI